jgi:hypothetical protein
MWYVLPVSSQLRLIIRLYLHLTETTKGVFQASGYADLTHSEHMWWGDWQQKLYCPLTFTYRFWFFAARKDPDNAPLAIWINGGVSPPLPKSARF